jgi:hypothetical protein
MQPLPISCSFLPYHIFSCEGEGVVTNVFLNESFIGLSTFIINREACYCSNKMVEIETNKCNETTNFSGFHLYIDHISSTMVRNSKFTSFGHNIPSQVASYVKYDPRETFQDNEALWFRSMVMLGYHYFEFSYVIEDNINTKTLSQGTFHAYFIHDSMKVCYFPVNSLHQFYDNHCRFYDRIEERLERSYLARFLIYNNYEFFGMMDRDLYNLISSSFCL